MKILEPSDVRVIEGYMARAHEAIRIAKMIYFTEAREQTLEVAERYLLLAFERFSMCAGLPTDINKKFGD